MGIKTYSISETAELLKGKGINVVLDGSTTLYVPGEMLLHKEEGVYKLNGQDEDGIRLIMSTADEDKICREVLKKYGVKTVMRTIKKGTDNGAK